MLKTQQNSISRHDGGVWICQFNEYTYRWWWCLEQKGGDEVENIHYIKFSLSVCGVSAQSFFYSASIMLFSISFFPFLYVFTCRNWPTQDLFNLMSFSLQCVTNIWHFLDAFQPSPRESPSCFARGNKDTFYLHGTWDPILHKPP